MNTVNIVFCRLVDSPLTRFLIDAIDFLIWGILGLIFLVGTLLLAFSPLLFLSILGNISLLKKFKMYFKKDPLNSVGYILIFFGWMAWLYIIGADGGLYELFGKLVFGKDF